MVGACFFTPFIHSVSGIQKLNFSMWELKLAFCYYLDSSRGQSGTFLFFLLNPCIYCSEALALSFPKAFLHPFLPHRQTAPSSSFNAWEGPHSWHYSWPCIPACEDFDWTHFSFFPSLSFPLIFISKHIAVHPVDTINTCWLTVLFIWFLWLLYSEGLHSLHTH